MATKSGTGSLAEYILNLNDQKVSKRLHVLLLQGFLAGLYIAIGAIACIRVSVSVELAGLGNFLGAMVFPLGIIAIVIMPAELFTSNCLIATSVYAGRLKIRKAVRVLLLVFLSNIIGALFAAFLTRRAGIFDNATVSALLEKAAQKAHMPFGRLLVSSILCNIVVCTGVCLSYNCKEEIAKIAVLWLSVAVFILNGTEHVVANMYYLFSSLFYGSKLAALDIIYSLIVSGIGNFIGGGIIVAGINYLTGVK